VRKAKLAEFRWLKSQSDKVSRPSEPDIQHFVITSGKGRRHMRVDFEYQKLRDLLSDLIRSGCSGIKMSTEDQGVSFEFIDMVHKRIIDGAVPLHVKIGGPDARNDIRKCLEMGVTGIIAPMVESPFGVHKFVTAVEEIAGADIAQHLFLSINLESLSAYEKIDEILMIKEIKAIDEMVVGTSDLAKSVGKPKSDSVVLDIVETMCTKFKKAGKIVRVGGVMSAFVSKQDFADRMIGGSIVDEVNTASVAFDVKKAKDLQSAYLKAINFEYELNECWSSICGKRLEPFRKKAASLRKILDTKS
jgi:hypothetical protein